jgi:hypothetical protein
MNWEKSVKNSLLMVGETDLENILFNLFIIPVES